MTSTAVRSVDERRYAMHHQRLKLVLAALLLAALPAAGLAQSTQTSGQATGVSTAKTALDQESPAAQASATADAKAKAEAEARLQGILARGAKTSAKSRASAE